MAWLAHAFYLHWRYTLDSDFLANRAYPWCAEVGQFIAAIVEPDAAGKLKLPVSSSPEIHDNSPAAWLPPNSNFDLALLRWLFGALREMADALGKAEEGGRWQSILSRLDDLHVCGADGPLKVCSTELLRESHRHHSHLMAIHPLGLLHVDQGERSRRIIQSSLRQIDALGTGNWVGYSFSWMACMAARVRQANRALNMLELYLKGFVSRNGFHLNGDFKNLGLSQFKYRPFTLEGNFAAAQAVHEMLVQVCEGVLHVFPATPDVWPDVSFERLRVDGALLVSARRQKGQTTWLRIESERGGTLRLHRPFATRHRWTKQPRERDALLIWDLAPGEPVEGVCQAIS
jgi:alpha-L-fucosidase 2